MCVLEYRRTAIAMNKPLKSGLVFDANFEHPTCKGKSIITMCFRLLPDSSLCQNGKQVEIITKMIFELCYIEAIIDYTKRVGGISKYVDKLMG